MSARAARRLALAAFALYVAFVAGTVALVAFADATADDLIVIAFAGYVAVGALIAARRPENAVGWLLVAIGLAFAFGAVTEAFVSSDLDVAKRGVGWISSASTPLFLAAAGVFLPLVFPHGRLLSPRWRAVAWFGAAGLGCWLAGTLLAPGSLDLDTEGIPNPLGLEGAAGDVAVAARGAGLAMLIPAVALSAVSLVVRFRRAAAAERQQLKWFAYVGSLALASLFGAALLATLESGADPAWSRTLGAVSWFSALFLIVVGLPAATGIAILRHRLYDIDVVIRRTLVYAALTATLGATYLAIVLLAGLTMGESDVAIAISTLAVAALFRPARARIQSAVDRRFYRRRYDAARILEGFGARLRDEVDLDALGADLRAVAAETVQPAHVSLWLRGVR